ncbi:MAG TPA: NAD-dependent protein deacetylase [Longimicrobiaceae bacterium]
MDLLTVSRAQGDVEALADHLRDRRVVALVGAGCSTESGIPDYRGPESIKRERRPIQYQEFVGRPAARVRYWARSMIGWPRIRAARPNAGHFALAAMEGSGLLHGVITQNVDGLHQAAGSRRVVELHGSLDRVRCLDCGGVVSRTQYQSQLLDLNTAWIERFTIQSGPGDAEAAPDGDAELPAEAMEQFAVPPCDHCGGVMKPDVVFFGENVPAETVASAWELFEAGDALLVLGSSLTVYSGRRFIYRAQKEGVPIAIVNVGPTRADEAAVVKVEGRTGEVLPRLHHLLLQS